MVVSLYVRVSQKYYKSSCSVYLIILLFIFYRYYITIPVCAHHYLTFDHRHKLPLKFLFLDPGWNILNGSTTAQGGG
ncbi:hypothetical protein K1T71_011492 [Dendrolimus kikuchii]|uniref:Uncharacterized protein n=1 Tax=Dendrolimus kikuchii TaxID=765133 RepID=A0ACC1CPC9_9NEOP|nr:hypothetical protein K1T71_011492 [Dendrolimus kikuchii]